ncbi:MAG: thiol reductase thioredoxin [Herminiimonas sp.]|nr:thiol reductase thioredoxin [Herminiimonas sp.]
MFISCANINAFRSTSHKIAHIIITFKIAIYECAASCTVASVSMDSFPNSLIVVAKRECPTCTLVEPLLRQIAHGATPLTVYIQDDPAYADGVPNRIYDRTLEHSFHLNIEIVPTLIRIEDGREVGRCYGWHRAWLARPATLDPLTVGILDISKARGNVLLDRVDVNCSARQEIGRNACEPAPDLMRRQVRILNQGKRHRQSFMTLQVGRFIDLWHIAPARRTHHVDILFFQIASLFQCFQCFTLNLVYQAPCKHLARGAVTFHD